MADKEGFDIYGDLEEFEKDEETKITKQNEEELMKKFNEALQEIDKLQNDNADLKNRIGIMNKNFSSLLMTAKAEIARKNNQIATLQQEKDDLCFRRKQNLSHGHQSAYAKNNPFRKTIENESYNDHRSKDYTLKDRQCNPVATLVNSREQGSSSNSKLHSRNISKDPDKYEKNKKQDYETDSRKRQIPRIIYDLEDSKSKQKSESITTTNKNLNQQKVNNETRVSKIDPKIFNKSNEKDKVRSTTVTSEKTRNIDHSIETIAAPTIRADLCVVYKKPKSKTLKSDSSSKTIDIQSNKDTVSSNSDNKILSESIIINKEESNKTSETDIVSNVDNKSSTPKNTEDILNLQGFLNLDEEFIRKDTSMENKKKETSSEIATEANTNQFQKQTAELYKSDLKDHENMSDKVAEDLQAYLCEHPKSAATTEQNEDNWFALSPKRQVKSKNNNNNEPELHSTLLSFSTICATDVNRNSIKNVVDGDVKVDEVKKRKIQTPKKITPSTNRSSKLVGHKIDGFEPERTRQASATEASRELKNALFEAVLKPLDANNDHENKTKQELVRRRFSEGSPAVTKKEELGCVSKSKSDIQPILNNSIARIMSEGKDIKDIVQNYEKSQIDDKEIIDRQENIEDQIEAGTFVEQLSPVNTTSPSEAQNSIAINLKSADTDIHTFEKDTPEIDNQKNVLPDETKLKDTHIISEETSKSERVEYKSESKKDRTDTEQLTKNKEEKVQEFNLTIEDGEIVEEENENDLQMLKSSNADTKEAFSDNEKKQADKEIKKSFKETNRIDINKRIDIEMTKSKVNNFNDMRNGTEGNKYNSRDPETSQGNIRQLKKSDSHDRNASVGKKEQLVRYNTQNKNCSEIIERDKKYNRTEKVIKYGDKYREYSNNSRLKDNNTIKHQSAEKRTNDRVKSQESDEKSSGKSRGVEEGKKYSNTKSYSARDEFSKTLSNEDNTNTYKITKYKEKNTTKRNNGKYHSYEKEDNKSEKNNAEAYRNEKSISKEEKIKNVPKEETVNFLNKHNKSENYDKYDRKEQIERNQRTDKDQNSIKENSLKNKKDESELKNEMGKHKRSTSDSTKKYCNEIANELKTSKETKNTKVEEFGKCNEEKPNRSKKEKTNKIKEEFVKKIDQLKNNESHETKSDKQTEEKQTKFETEENIATVSDKKRHCGTIVLRNQSQLKKSQILIESYGLNISPSKAFNSDKKKDSKKIDLQTVDERTKTADKRKNTDNEEDLINNEDIGKSSTISALCKKRKLDKEKNSSKDSDNNLNIPVLISNGGKDTGEEKDKTNIIHNNISSSTELQICSSRKRKLEKDDIQDNSPKYLDVLKNEQGDIGHNSEQIHSGLNCENRVNEEEIFIVNTSKVILNKDDSHLLNPEINDDRILEDLEAKVAFTGKLDSKTNKDIPSQNSISSSNIELSSPNRSDSTAFNAIMKHSIVIHSHSTNITKTLSTTAKFTNGSTCLETLQDIVTETANDDELFDRVFRSPTTNSILDGDINLQVSPDTSKYEEDMEISTPIKTMERTPYEEHFKNVEKIFKDIFRKSPSVEKSICKRNILDLRQAEEEEKNNSTLITESFQIQTSRLDDTGSLLTNKSNISESNADTSATVLNQSSGNGKVISMSSGDYTIEAVSNNVVNVFITRKKTKRKKKKIEG